MEQRPPPMEQRPPPMEQRPPPMEQRLLPMEQLPPQKEHKIPGLMDQLDPTPPQGLFGMLMFSSALPNEIPADLGCESSKNMADRDETGCKQT
ncbi:hypothetical protein JTB14_037375 [Gonioctena quinquepunctata]|nr:hypothetical protein JTB14_037375 [Gonioctena quinquepunctata]